MPKTIEEVVRERGFHAFKPKGTSMFPLLREGYDAVLFARRSRSNPSNNPPVVDEQVDVAGSCYLGISYLNQAVYIFCADSEEQYDAVVSLLIKKIMHNGR